MTPLLRWNDALLKLELFRPRGSVSDRAPVPEGTVELSGNQALSFARSGAELALRGAVTHEMREALKIWGARIVPRAKPWNPDPALFARTLGAELLEQLGEAPPLIVCPAGEGAALLGALAALRQRWPRVRGVALVAAGEELPDLPRSAELPAEIEQVAIARHDAARARARLGRELGLLANHAGAAAAGYAHGRGGVAIVTAPGEREFSLEARP
jgi:cysteine synthase